MLVIPLAMQFRGFNGMDLEKKLGAPPQIAAAVRRRAILTTQHVSKSRWERGDLPHAAAKAAVRNAFIDLLRTIG